MNTGFPYGRLLLVLAAAALVHPVDYLGFSIVAAPLVLSVILAFVRLPSFVLPLIVIIAFELFTTLPAGILAAAMLVPFLVRTLAKPEDITLSGSHAAIICTTVALQILVIVGATALPAAVKTGEQLQASAAVLLQYTPVVPGLITLAGTSAVAYILLIAWHEHIVPPHERRS